MSISRKHNIKINRILLWQKKKKYIFFFLPPCHGLSILSRVWIYFHFTWPCAFPTQPHEQEGASSYSEVGKNNGAAKFHPWEKFWYSFKNARKAAGFALRYQGENWYLCRESFINTWKNTENTWEDVQKSATTWQEYQLFLLGIWGILDIPSTYSPRVL